MKLSKMLNVPLEHLMHMPQHILLQKLALLAKEDSASPGTDTAASPDAGSGTNGEPS